LLAERFVMKADQLTHLGVDLKMQKANMLNGHSLGAQTCHWNGTFRRYFYFESFTS
jgi:hypothetical protein